MMTANHAVEATEYRRITADVRKHITRNDMSKERNMTTDGRAQIEREETDESLRLERNRTDHVLAAKQKITQDLADGVVEHAREQADEVLDAAREKADKKLDTDGTGEAAPNAVARESVAQDRAEEDVALKQERASADDNLRWEREEQSRILAVLLPLERAKTDRNLQTEREISDDAVVYRDDIMSMISHELRNLLVGITFQTTLLARQASNSDEGRRTLASVDCIERCVAGMNRLIGDLVDVACIDAGKLTVHPKPGDVSEMLSEAITPFAHAAQEKGLLLEVDTDGQTLLGVFDWERMLQVVANLIANAMRFTPRGGTITLKAAHSEDDLRVSVLDTGEGIAADMREVIFERFRQEGGNDHGGLGLGLYISRCIVEAQGGRIWAESNPSGIGSAFHLTIHAPARATPHKKVRTKASTEPSLAKARSAGGA